MSTITEKLKRLILKTKGKGELRREKVSSFWLEEEGALSYEVGDIMRFNRFLEVPLELRKGSI